MAFSQNQQANNQRQLSHQTNKRTINANMIRAISLATLLVALSASSVPTKFDCASEYTSFASDFSYDAQLLGNRDANVNRQQIFCATLKEIKAHNAGNSTYTQGVNQFSDWTDKELSTYVSGFKIDTSNAAAELPLYEMPSQYAPLQSTSDFRNKMPAAKQQGGCGSCWTFGAVDVVDFFGGSHSEQQLLDCAPSHGCDGGDPRQALQYLASTSGSVTENSYKYTKKKGQCKKTSGGTKVSQVAAVASNENALASAGKKQVVSIAITFKDGSSNKGFMSYKSGVFDGECTTPGGGGHAVGVVGVQSDYYIVRNSWGQGWGQNGHVYMKRGKNVCNLAQHSTVAHA